MMFAAIHPQKAVPPQPLPDAERGLRTLVTVGEPMLDADEKPLFERVLAARWARYQEFGVGGSTPAALRSGVGTFVGVDSDLRWVEAVRSHADVAGRLCDGSASVIHAEVGPVGDWGHPSDTAWTARWPSYSALAWAEWARRGSFPQLAYVDGRFRVACCLSAVLSCPAAAGEPPRPPLVMVRCAFDTRPYYAPVREFFEPVAAAGSLHLLRWKLGASLSAAFNAFLAHQFDPR